MKNLTDFEIIESIKRGNHSDFSILVDRYKNKAFSLLKRMLKNDMEAEEILQDAFIKTFNGLKNFKKESKFSTWFYRIVYNTAISLTTLSEWRVEVPIENIVEKIAFTLEPTWHPIPGIKTNGDSLSRRFSEIVDLTEI